MYYILVAIAVVLVVFVAFIAWRIGSVARGARQRDEKIAPLLEPLGTKLTDRQPVTPDEVAALAAQPQVRLMLYAMLRYFERLELFPAQYVDTQSQGAAQLAYWMMHPNELQDAPAEIELVESITRPLTRAGGEGEFLVYRYRMGEGHWAAGDGWLLGLAGPYLEGEPPYSGTAGAFSRCDDKYGQLEPSALVDWYIDLARQKSAPWIDL